MTVWVREGGAWKQSRYLFRYDAGTPESVAKGWVREGGAWRLFYAREVATTTKFTTQPTDIMHDGTLTAAGTVIDADGNNVNGGQIRFRLYRGTTLEGEMAERANVVNGVWSVSFPSFTRVGTFTLVAQFHPAGDMYELPSEATSDPFDVGIAAVGQLAAGSSAHTSCSFSWAAVPGAQQYEIYNGAGKVKTVSGTSSGTITVSENTQYDWKVRALGDNSVVGAFSPVLHYNGGRPAKRDTGQATVHVDCTRSGCHRNDSTGWGSTHVRQGYYRTPYGGGGYIGVFDYGSTTAVRDKIIATVGRARYDNGSPVSGYTIAARRGDVGNQFTATLSFRVSKQGVGGARPSLAGTPANVTFNYEQRRTVPLNTSLLSGLAKGGYRSLCIHRDTTADYAALNKAETDHQAGDLWITWKWDYVSQTKIDPKWWR